MTATTAQYARTFSATRRHIINPENIHRTLCGESVALPEHYTGDDGQPKTAESWMVRDLTPCGRCARSARSRGIEG